MKVSISIAALAAALSGDHFDLISELADQGATITSAPLPISEPGKPPLAGRILDFLRNDQSGFDWRSADAIAKALGDASADQVAEAARNDGELVTKNSTRGMGVLISLA
jgi:hypothetical protein